MHKGFIIFMLLPAILISCKSGQKATSSSKSKKSSHPEVKLDKATRERIDRLFVDAEKSKAIEDWDNALKSYSEVLQTDPYNADVYFQMAQIYIEQNKTTGAEQQASMAVRLDPKNKWYLELLATIYLQENKVKEALEAFKGLIERFPGNPDYYLNLAFLYSKTGQFENAIKTYDQYEKNFGIDENVINEKKNLYLHLNKFAEALSEVQKLVDAFPGETQYLLMEADLYRANKMKDKAAELYKKVLQTEPDNAQALLALADPYLQGTSGGDNLESLKKIFANPKVDVDTKVKILYPYLQYWNAKKDKKQDAFDLAEILTQTHPSEAKAWALKGDLYYLDNQNDKALESYLKSLDLRKDVFQVWQQVLIIYNMKRDWVSLEKTCNDVLEYFPNQAVIYLFKGGAEFQNKELDKSLNSFLKGEKMSGDNDKLKAQFFSDLGDTYHSLKRDSESDSAYEQSLKLDGDNANVLNNYAYYLSVRKKNLEKAKEMSAYSNKLEPDNSSYLDTYAWILFQLGDYSGAKDWQEKALKVSNEKSGTLLEHYGDIMFKLGNKDQAVEYWKKAKDLGTDSDTINQKIAEQRYIE